MCTLIVGGKKICVASPSETTVGIPTEEIRCATDGPEKVFLPIYSGEREQMHEHTSKKRRRACARNRGRKPRRVFNARTSVQHFNVD